MVSLMSPKYFFGCIMYYKYFFILSIGVVLGFFINVSFDSLGGVGNQTLKTGLTEKKNNTMIVDDHENAQKNVDEKVINNQTLKTGLTEKKNNTMTVDDHENAQKNVDEKVINNQTLKTDKLASDFIQADEKADEVTNSTIPSVIPAPLDLTIERNMRVSLQNEIVSSDLEIFDIMINDTNLPDEVREEVMSMRNQALEFSMNLDAALMAEEDLNNTPEEKSMEALKEDFKQSLSSNTDIPLEDQQFLAETMFSSPEPSAEEDSIELQNPEIFTPTENDEMNQEPG